MEYYPFMVKFTKTVIRSFYDPYDIVIMDILLEKLILKETEFCDEMKISLKEFNKRVVRLRDDKLFKQESKIETDKDGKQTLCQVFYIDFKEIRDIIRYKIHMMTKLLDEEIKKMQESEGYICENCKKEFTVLDVQSLAVDFVFRCDECNKELVENKKENNPHDLYCKMMKEMEDVINMLKEADKLDLPNVDYFQAIEMKDKLKIEKKIKKEEVKEKKKEIIDDIGDKEIVFEDFIKEEVEEKKEIDEMIMVGGRLKKYCEITDEDKEMMNEEEYEKYYEVFLKYQN